MIEGDVMGCRRLRGTEHLSRIIPLLSPVLAWKAPNRVVLTVRLKSHTGQSYKGHWYELAPVLPSKAHECSLLMTRPGRG